MTVLLKELLAEDRNDDLEKIRVANESCGSIVAYIQKLGKDPKRFASVFKVHDGYFLGFALGARIRREEHVKLSVYFVDRGLYGIRSKVNAQATRVRVRPESQTSAAIKGYSISIYFDAPAAVRASARTYNKWLAENLAQLLSDDTIRSTYVHEFAHVVDFRRMDPQFLLRRSQEKRQDRELRQQTPGAPRDFVKYANDPLELNAYFQQGMSDVVNQLSATRSDDERRAVIGRTPQEFAARFVSTFLKKQVRKNLTPENEKRLMKRAAGAWAYL